MISPILARSWLPILGLAILSPGCACLSSDEVTSKPANAQSAAGGVSEPSAVTVAGEGGLSLAPPSEPAPFATAEQLNLDALIQEVLARNPSLAEMNAAWQAASARYPQVTSLDDPMVAGTFGPETIHPDDRGVEFGSRIEVSQKFPWPGKRQLRGENALAEASAAENSIEDMRLQLIESAKDAFYEYYLVDRALAVNEETLERLRQFRLAAQALYRTPPKEKKVSFQDVYQTDVEIGRTQERRVTLERMRRVAVARMNTLMHRAPDLALPPPPKEVGDALSLPEPQALRAEALSRRPDLQALANHIAAEQASLDLAYKEFYPDLEPFFMYDRFMGNTSANRDLATMLGVKLNLPVWQARRRGAVTEAEARLAQRRAEFDSLSDRINFQVQDAYERVRENAQVLKLYKEKILPDIELNVKTAQADYTAGLVPAVSVIQAERDRLTLYDRYYEAIAEYHRRLATLDRAIGGPLDGTVGPQAKGPGDL